MAEKGLGTVRDLDLAERSNRAAAAKGSAEAQAALGRLLVRHRDNVEEGLFWLEVAVLRAPDEAARRLHTGDRDQVRERLDPDDAKGISSEATRWRSD